MNAPKPSLISALGVTQVHPKVRVYNTEDEQAVVALWGLVFPDDPPWNEPTSVIQGKLTVQPELFFVCESGCSKLNLQVRDGNSSAASFYKELGYDVEKRISMSKHIGQASSGDA